MLNKWPTIAGNCNGAYLLWVIAYFEAQALCEQFTLDVRYTVASQIVAWDVAGVESAIE